MNKRNSNMLWAVGIIFLTIFTCVCNFALYLMEKPKTPDQLIVDGADFTPAVELGENMIQGAAVFLMTIGYGIAIIILSLVICLILRFLVIRKISGDAVDYRTKMNLFKIMAVLSVVISLVFTAFKLMFSSFVYTGLWTLIAYLILIIPLKKLHESGLSGNEV